ncbi:MAG: replicative DNA helicase [Bdellovibrionales bacterium]|nr:replicative DNA helicase [Bdellovibrionales bacterium]
MDYWTEFPRKPSQKSDRRSEGSRDGGASYGSMTGNRVPPHEIEAERAVLGAILVHNDTYDRVRELGLTPEDFYTDSHRKIFEVYGALAEKGQPIDLVTVTSSLRDRAWFDEIGGTGTLTGIFDEAFAVGNVTEYAKRVRDKALIRRLVDACSTIITDAYEGVPEIESFVDEAERKVFEVSGDKSQKSFADMRSVLMGNMATIEELALKKQDVTGLATGFKEFDRLTTGLHGGQTIVVAARPGMGKTSWFLSALQHAAIDSGKVVALFSLEMSKEEMGFRMLSGLARIDSRNLKVGRLADQDWHRLADAADKLSKARIFIDDSGALSIMDIRARCRRLKTTEKRLDLVVVDYLQLMRGSKASQKGDSSREREISEISRGLKQLAKELKVPIIALSQLNRGVESRQDKRPTLSDLRESGAIEQDADIVTFIHREDYYNKDTEEKGIAEFIIAKNRSGETATVRLGWQGRYTLFVNLDDHQGGGPADRHYPEKGDVGF